MARNGKANGRDDRGRFAEGNAGGPGRPARPIERQYIAVIGDVVGLDAWRAVVDRALTDAKAGDATARAWLSKYVTGDPPHATLFSLAVNERIGCTAEADVANEAQRRQDVQQQQAEDVWRDKARRAHQNAIDDLIYGSPPRNLAAKPSLRG